MVPARIPTQIDSATFDDHDLTILLTGDQAETDAVRAYAKADLWERVFGQRVTLEKVAEPGADAPQIPILTAPRRTDARQHAAIWC